MTAHQIKQLLTKQQQGNLSEKEKALLESWYLSEAHKPKPKLSQQDVQLISDRIKSALPLQYPDKQEARLRLWPRIAAAAALVCLIGIGFYYSASLHKNKASNSQAKSDTVVNPGQQKATLVLANGQEIELSTSENGTLSKEAGVQISKTADGSLIYTIQPTAADKSAKPSYNTLLTAAGEQYQVMLPDGSHVWLNAASSLRYPTTFKGKERVVSLTGEAYFEVAHQSGKPFKVQTEQQTVEVLGTHFNINAYADEATTKTTLLEGRVKIQNSTSKETHILQPGQQASLTDKHIRISPAQLAEVTAWKDGLFRFNGASIQSIMRQLARWYNIEVIYEGSPSEESFFARFDRNLPLEEVLAILTQSEKITCTLKGRTVFVSKHT